MKTLFRRRRNLLAGSALAVMLTVGLVAVAPQFSSPASAQSGPSCADPVTSAPTGPATVSAALTPYGKALVVGSGGYAGCSLYLLTSDRLHALTGAPFACSDNSNATGSPCDTVLWPALLTQGAPMAGRGVNPALQDAEPLATPLRLEERAPVGLVPADGQLVLGAEQRRDQEQWIILE
jgi:hypothetical protein